jgi:hypothetical protein
MVLDSGVKALMKLEHDVCFFKILRTFNKLIEVVNILIPP